MRKFFPVEDLARDSRFSKITIADRMADQRTALNVNVDANGDWFTGEQRVNTAELASHLKARFKNHPPLKLQVRADASTPAARIKELMNLAADAGAAEVVYGVRKR